MQQQTPLDDEQLATLARTRQTTRKLRWARLIALSNVLGLATFAVLSLSLGLLEGVLAPIALALGALAWNEERGRRGLIAADPLAPRRLAHNQLLLLACMLVYCGWNAYGVWVSPSGLDAVLQAQPDLATALGDAGATAAELSDWARNIALVTYGAVAAGSALVQGLTAVYYLSLRPTLDELAAAPAWARALS